MDRADLRLTMLPITRLQTNYVKPDRENQTGLKMRRYYHFSVNGLAYRNSFHVKKLVKWTPEVPSPPTPRETLPAEPLLRLPVPLKTQSMSEEVSGVGTGDFAVLRFPARGV